MTTTEQFAAQPPSPLATAPARAFRPVLIATGVVIGVQGAAEQFLSPDDGPASVAFAQTPLNTVLGLAGLAGFVLLVFALGQIHRRHDGAGLAEAVFWVLAVVFAIFAAGATWAETIFDPFIAQLAPAAFGGDEPPGLIGLGFTVTYVGLAVAVAAYAVTVAVLGRLARIPAILLAVGALATAAPFSLVGILLVAVALIWLAVAPARQPGAH